MSGRPTVRRSRTSLAGQARSGGRDGADPTGRIWRTSGRLLVCAGAVLASARPAAARGRPGGV